MPCTAMVAPQAFYCCTGPQEFVCAQLSKYMLKYTQTTIISRNIDPALGRLFSDDSPDMAAAADRALAALPTATTAAAMPVAGGAEGTGGAIEGEDGDLMQAATRVSVPKYQIAMERPEGTLAEWVAWCQKRRAAGQNLPPQYRLQVRGNRL